MKIPGSKNESPLDGGGGGGAGHPGPLLRKDPNFPIRKRRGLTNKKVIFNGALDNDATR